MQNALIRRTCVSDTSARAKTKALHCGVDTQWLQLRVSDTTSQRLSQKIEWHEPKHRVRFDGFLFAIALDTIVGNETAIARSNAKKHVCRYVP
jgi:hypothetical protein